MSGKSNDDNQCSSPNLLYSDSDDEDQIDLEYGRDSQESNVSTKQGTIIHDITVGDRIIPGATIPTSVERRQDVTTTSDLTVVTELFPPAPKLTKAQKAAEIQQKHYDIETIVKTIFRDMPVDEFESLCFALQDKGVLVKGRNNTTRLERKILKKAMNPISRQIINSGKGYEKKSI